MGAYQSDFYATADLPAIQFRDLKPIRYLWIDQRIHNQENRSYFIKFKEAGFAFQCFDTTDLLKAAINTADQKKWSVRIITAGHWPDQAYTEWCNHKKIDKIILFCGNKDRAKILLENNPKIHRKPTFGYLELTRILKELERQNDKNIYFFDVKNLPSLNLFRINVETLLKEISKSESKKQFGDFVYRFFPNQYENFKQYDKEFEAAENEEKKRKNLIEWGLKSTFLEKTTFELLKATRDPLKLAYVRHPVHQLYEAIKFQYKGLAHGYLNAFAAYHLKEDQVEELLTAKYITFSTFIKAYEKQEEVIKVLLSDWIFHISICEKNQKNTSEGFASVNNPKKYLFNIKNVYKIKDIDKENRTVSVELVSLPQNCSKDHPDYGIFIHKEYIINQIKHSDGQSLALEKAKNFIKRDEILKRKINQLIKIKSVESVNMYKIEIAKGKMQNDPIQAEKQLNLILNETNQHKILCYKYLLEIAFRNNQFAKIEAYLFNIRRVHEQLSALKKINVEYYLQISLFEVLLKIKNQIYDESYKILMQLLADANQAYKEANRATKIVQEILKQLVACCFHLKKYSDAIAYANQIIFLETVCEGNIELLQDMKNYKMKIELDLQKSIVKSKINMKELCSRKQSPMKIDISCLDLKLYDLG